MNLEVLLANLATVAQGKGEIDAILARSAISEFEKSGRPKSLGKDISVTASKIIKRFGKNLLSENSQLFGIIYDIASYIRWKTLDDLNSTAIEILENVIEPTNKLLFSQNFKSSNITELTRVAFIPSSGLFPRNFKNANQTGAYGLVDSYISAKNETNVELFVYVHSDGSKDPRNNFYYENVKIYSFQSYAELISKIREDKIQTIIQDYFMWSNVVLTYNLSDIPSIHLDPGFLPYFFAPVKRVIALPAQRHFGQQIDQIGRRCRYLARPLANAGHLAELSQRVEFNPKNIKLGSLGRGEKLTSEYVEFISSLLRRFENSKFLWAGDRALEKKNLFPADLQNRVEIYPFMNAGNFLSQIDFFIETFPENQGYAVLDALCMDCIVISYDPYFSNANRSERLSEMMFADSDKFVNFLDSLIKNEALRSEIIIKQRELISMFPNLAQYWLNFVEEIR